MTVNLLEQAKSFVTDAVISRLSGLLNESPEAIQKALTGAFPLFLNGMLSRINTPDGVAQLSGMVDRFMAHSAADATNANDPAVLITSGKEPINAVFAAKTDSISEALAQFSGVKKASATSLLSLAGSVIMGLIGGQITSQGDGTPVGLSALLTSQREAVAGSMPAGLAVRSESRPVTTSHTPAYSDSITDGRKGRPVWPWLLAAVAAVGLFFLLTRNGSSDSNTINTITNDTTSASVSDATVVDDSVAANPAVLVDSADVALAKKALSDSLANVALGTFSPKKLPDGIELNLPANGIENKLIVFVEDSLKGVDKTTWFNFDRLLYETGSATLRPESREQLQNMAAILKAYPAVALKIGGYTDNTGNAADNKTLSQSRAESVVAELVRLGVAVTRLEAEGYGQQHPVASNKTEEGRAQNRRTAVRVMKK
ncbi:OmpA family protein [Fibrella aquatica]|uniref:OmpA family protein n=1 Tax=Fibrella aquatica TaxID=3242487 RepID=UPI003520BD87